MAHNIELQICGSGSDSKPVTLNFTNTASNVSNTVGSLTCFVKAGKNSHRMFCYRSDKDHTGYEFMQTSGTKNKVYEIIEIF